MSQTAILKNKKCLSLLSNGLALGMFYALFVVASPWLSLDLPPIVLTLYWAVVKLTLGIGLLCIFQSTHLPKIAFAAILMLVSAAFSPFPADGFLTLAVEALALTGLSLTLFDISRAFPGLKLSVPAGVIFLGVIFSMLNNPMMLSIAGFAWLFGFLFASNQVRILTRVRLKEEKTAA